MIHPSFRLLDSESEDAQLATIHETIEDQASPRVSQLHLNSLSNSLGCGEGSEVEGLQSFNLARLSTKSLLKN